ncbi:hypothetical protein PRIPAC_70783 [Pristionchus pacificus]|uniref:C2H2-type domain-containing protein n=1 Tax=Pristionchus pacificus TaxID=54126 RepID=A0A2A6CFB1_PRIPA|nr:hypothetical protein PRIPAC_70783 [Pristionchus pacificus]|eukprot:PDM76894.1 hypothetical protein PRIPAC_42289 [Pristionchus pacificus]
MPPAKRGVSARGRPDLRDDEFSPASSPRSRGAHDAFPTRVGKGRIDSPTKSPHSAARRPLTSEDVRAEASPILPRGRGRPPKIPSAEGSSIVNVAASPSRRSRRITEQAGGGENLPVSSRMRLDSQSTVASRTSPPASPMTSPSRGRKKSEMESVDEQSEGIGEPEGRGKRKRKLTEAAEAAQAQSRSRKSSRRISERAEEHLDDDVIEPILEELTDIEEEEHHEVHEEQLEHPEDHDDLLDEVAHEEMVHAVSPHDMYIQHHMPVVRPRHHMQRTRGMHVVEGHDDELDRQLVEEEEAIEEMVVYDEDGNMIIGYDGEVMEEEIDDVEEDEMMRHHDPRRQHMGPPPHEVKEEPRHPGDDDGVGGGGGGRPQEDGGDDDDDDQPPQLEPEEGPGPEEIMMQENIERGQLEEEDYEAKGYQMVQSPGGTQYYQEPEGDDDLYADPMDQSMMQIVGGGGAEEPPAGPDLRTVEFNFLDNKHICCGMCGEIVPYDNLLREHLPLHHPEVYGGDGAMDLEEISYDTWLKDKLTHDRKTMENGFRSIGYSEQQGTTGMSRVGRNTRVLRRVSQVRVNPASMSLAELDVALKKKMVEKMGRKVKVSLVDKQHARCGICNAIVSLNKKFEVIHLVRHFNAWHPSSHRCAGTWPARAVLTGVGKPLSSQDFAVVDVALEAPESLQCIWCGMFMDRTMLAMHFHEVHPEDVEVPKCHLCLQEVVINARLLEKYGEDFEITLPDEHHIRCTKVQGTSFSTEVALDRCIDRRLRRMAAAEAAGGNEIIQDEDDDDDEDGEAGEGADPNQRDVQYSNSRMSFGRRNKPKRNFIMPSLRQAIPQDSRYVEAISEGEWRCKMCGEPILAAVISAGAIKHYRAAHREQVDDMQYELCKARLERVSDGCMEFVHPQLIECLICNLTYTLHKPYNMCRGIRHLKTKHPEMMPEYNRNGDQAATMAAGKGGYNRSGAQQRLEVGEYVEDPAIISKLKQEYDIEFDKVQTMVGPDGQQIFVLVNEGQEINAQLAQNIQASMLDEEEEEGSQPAEEGEEGEGEGGEEGENGVIVEEEEYQMDDEIVVQQRGDVHHMAAGGGVRRGGHQMGLEEEVVEEEEVPHDEEEMGEELEESELVEEQEEEEGHYE